LDLDLAGRRALVTGGSRGIGRATALILAEEGCNVTIVARDRGQLEETAAAIRARAPVAVTVVAADLATAEGIEAVAGAACAVDILVNNAGAIPHGGLLAVDDATWRQGWELKVFGYIALCRALYPAMAAQGGGVIVNIIGGAGEKANPDYIAGAAGNASLMGFTRALGRSSTRDGIRVVGINPGAIATARQAARARAKAAALFGDATRWMEMFRDAPFGRMGTPEEIGAAVAFLASPRAGYVSGTILTIDGGG